MNRLVAALALAAFTLAGCDHSDQVEIGASSEPRARSAKKLELPEADGPAHEVGTFGDQCERGAPTELGAPDADWSERVLDAAVDSNGEILPSLGSPVRIRFPRQWHDDWADSSLEPFSVTSDYANGNGLAEVGIVTLPDAELTGLGNTPWDARIEFLEMAKSLDAKAATPTTGGRCFVTGHSISGVFGAVLSPTKTQDTLVALATFPGSFDEQRSIEDVEPDILAVTLRVLNSVEHVDTEPPAS